MSVPPPPPGSDIPPQAPMGVAPGYDGAVSSDDKTMAMIAHVLGIFTGFIGPLIIYLIKKDQSRFVTFHAMQALCFQVAIAILYVICYIITAVTLGLLFFLPIVPAIISLIYSIIAAMAANKGDLYDYPVTSKFARQQANM